MPERVRRVAEEPDGSGLHVHPEWAETFPWIAQGVTGRDADMSLFGSAATGEVLPRWQRLRDRLGCRSMVHARQVHRSVVLIHGAQPPGIVIGPDADGHATGVAGTLLAVSVADCVPILIVAPRTRSIAALHGGWRGVAAGILERGVAVLQAEFGARPADLHVHCGPAICGECFEVGGEVPEGLGMDAVGVTHVDLRAHLAQRVIELGVAPGNVTISEFCTRHGNSPFYSHRGGCAERQIAAIAIRNE